MTSAVKLSSLAQIASLPEAKNLPLFAEMMKAAQEAGEDATPYFAALGKFVVEYALAESEIHQLARKLSGLSDEKARIIFGGMRLGDVFDRVRQMMRLDKADDKTYKMVDNCLTHLGELADKRGRLVHRLVSYEKSALYSFTGGHFRVSNYATAKTSSAIEEEKFTLSDLENMTLDCSLIFLRIMNIRNPEIFQNKTPDGMKFLHYAWRYTPSPPDTLMKKSPVPKGRKAPKPRRSSSRK